MIEVSHAKYHKLAVCPGPDYKYHMTSHMHVSQIRLQVPHTYSHVRLQVPYT